LKRIFLFLLFSLAFISCKSTHSGIKNATKTSEISEQIVKNAKTNIGSPYKSAGTTKAGFDCSGLVYVSFKNSNINLPRTSIEMSKQGHIIDKDEARKGDLIFFKTNGSTKINHVGLIVEVDDDEIKFIHSSSSKGVIISSIKEAYYKKSFVQINRVIE
jgi:murein DD-endopeptidase / murein LD-carboxypeptidase